MSKDIVSYTISDMEKLAVSIAKSGLFGISKPEEALSLMAIAQAEGLHPAIAARDYHIIKGRPSLKADAMLARFQASGGRVEWHSYTDECCDATISHPQGGTIRVMWDMQRVKKAEIQNDTMYKKYPRNMLRARVISEGIRTVYPGVCVGVYTPEEVDSFEPVKSPMAKWAETPPPPIVIDQKPEEKVDRLKTAYEELLKRLNSCTNKDSVTALVAKNKSLLLALYEHMPELHEKLSMEVNRHKEAFDLSDAAE